MQLNLIKEVLTGAITGYITNAMAIKMIFREYGVGKLKLGGVIVKTREEFINNISSLVEREIINPHTLKEELSKETFKNSIESFAYDLLNTCIYESSSNLKVKELKGFEGTINKTQNYIKYCAQEQLPDIFDNISKRVYLKDILNQKQVQYISGQSFKCVLHQLDNSNFIEETIKSFYEENKTINFGDFFGDKLLKVIGDNVENSIKNLHGELKNNFDKEIDIVFENTIETLEVNKILDPLEEKFLEKRIVDFIDNKDGINLSKRLMHKIKDFVLSDEGKGLIKNFSEEVHNLLKNIDKPVFEILSGNLKDNAEGFLKDKLEYAVKELILWIEKNKEDIDGLIEAAIDDTINSIDDEMKKNILGVVKDKFLNDVADKFDIVSKITEYLEENTDIDYISKDITLTIINYLKEEKISDIIYKLEKNNIFTVESLSNTINDNIVNYIEYIPEDYFCGVLDKKIKDIFNVDLVNIFEKYAKGPIIDSLKYKYIYTQKATEVITETLIKNIKNMKSLNLSEIISEEDLSLNYDNIKKLAIDKLQNNESYFITSFSAELEKWIDSNSLYDSLKGDTRNILLEEVIKEVSNRIENFLEESKEIELKVLCDTINKIDNIKGEVTDFTVSTLKENLPYILNGNIKKAVSSNLRNLKDEELQTMVEEFMGKEMKPITVIGALLGAIVGIGMYFFDNSVTQYNYLTAMIISVVVYGFVGWLTNVQALEMLFKPYYEKKLFGIKIPFTPGVIVSRKPKFAKSMSTFVDEELLKKSSMEELFNKNVDNIYNSIKDIVAKDEYKLVINFLNKHREHISDKGFDYIKTLIETNKDDSSKALCGEMKHLKFNKVDFSKIKNRSEEEILLRIKNSNKIIYTKLNTLLKYDSEVSSVIPENFKASLKEKISNIVQKEINNLTTHISKKDRRTELLLMFLSKHETIADNSIREIISHENILKWQETINDIVSDKITSENTKRKFLNWIENRITKETANDKKLGEIFGGFFTKIIESNFSYIMDNTIKVILKGLTDNQQAISEVAISTTKESLNFFELMGYNMLGGDDIVASIIDNLINDKFPAFIENKKEELKPVLENFIDNRICSSSVEILNLSFQYEEILDVVDKFISDKENVERLNHKVINVTDSLFNWVTDIKLRECLSLISINKIEDLIDVFEDEINFTSGELENSINKKIKVLTKDYTEFAWNIVSSLILSNKVKVFAEGIEDKDIQELADKLSELFSNSNSIRNGSSKLIQVLENELKQKELKDLLELEELNKSIVFLLEKLLEDDDLNSDIKVIMSGIVKNIIENNLNIVDASTKEEVIKIIITSVLDSASKNFSNIINAIDFRRITESQINAMEPREIEELFNSFAKKYFNKLKLYGIGGAVFGIHWIVGVVTFILYALSGVKNEINRKN